MLTHATLEAARAIVHDVMPPTPQYAWPLLANRIGADVWVKHENHTPTGAFKVRGGLVYMNALRQAGTAAAGVVTATRGNHGQSIALAGARHGIPVTIVVPRGNSAEKNAAMAAFGAEVVTAGADFDEARGHAGRLAEQRGLLMLPSYDQKLVEGVATYAFELFSHVPDIDTVYVPIGLGSGISSVIQTRDLLGLKTRVVGVVTRQLDAYARSFEAGKPVSTGAAATIADGMACRTPEPAALEVILKGAERIVRVEDDEIRAAILALYTDTHNLAEGAGAAPLAALMQEREAMKGRRVAVILTGGNIDLSWFRRLLRESRQA